MANSTLLLADDSVTIQKVVNLTFSGEGIEVVSVGDGNSALDFLRESPPDLVMADVNMPGVNGYELCEKVKAMDVAREIPVILLVGSFEPFDEDEAKRVGANAHLTKPFESIAALAELVHGYIAPAAPPQRQAFQDTIEYPDGEEMVVSASSIPFAGGFEDETIEAEQVGSEPAEMEPDAYEESFAPVEDFDTAEPAAEFRDEAAQEWDGGTGEQEPSQEFEIEYSEDAESYQGDEDRADAGPGEPQEYEIEYSEEAESYQGYEHRGESDSEEPEYEIEYSEEGEPEPLYADHSEPEPMPEPGDYGSDAFGEAAGEPAYAEFEGSQDSEFSGDYQEPAPSFDGSFEEDREDDFTPIPLGPSDEDLSATRDLGSVTVELDESELLELPVELTTGDLTTVPEEEPVSLSEDPFAQTIREPAFEEVRTEETWTEETHTEEFHTEEVRLEGVSEDLIEEIVQRVVERLSDRAVREIAWEVVPDLAELIIRRIAEEKMNN